MRCNKGTCKGHLSVSPDWWVTCSECGHMFICPDQMKPVFEGINENYIPKKNIQVKMRSYSVKCDLYKHYKWSMKTFERFLDGY